MAKALDDNNVHTVISALRVFDPASSDAESNLVKATAKAKTPKRFIASAWGIQYADEYAFSSQFLYNHADLGQDTGWTSSRTHLDGTAHDRSGMDPFRQRLLS